MAQKLISADQIATSRNSENGIRIAVDEYATFGSGVASPLPAAQPENVSFGFQAANSTDLPGPGYVGVAVTGPNGSQAFQLAVKWDTNGVQPNDMYVRVADPSAGNVWSPWARVHTGNITFTTDTSEPVGGSPGDIVYVYEV